MLREALGGMFSRFYSSKAPAKLYSLQGRYATALFNAASKTNRLKEVESEITKIKSFISKNGEILAFLENPSIARESKMSMVESMFAKQKYSDLTVNMFRAMAEYGRLDNTMKVIASFEQLMKDYNSVVIVKVISNQQLSSDVQSKLEALVQKKFVTGENKPVITWAVDDKIMGGLIIEVGDNVVDMSVASKATAISKELMSSL